MRMPIRWKFAGPVTPLVVTAIVWGMSVRTSSPPTSHLLASSGQVPAGVRPVLERACINCHSNETQWPWYAHVPLVSGMIERDVQKAQEHLDFSSWAGASPHRATVNELQEICDAVSDGAMPPLGYRVMHSEARLSQQDKELLCTWPVQVRTARLGH